MRKILKIAKLELSILIYSPVIWIVLPIFCVLCSITVMGTLESFQNSIALHGRLSSPITRNVYGIPAGFFVTIQQTLYLYLPILTMGIMSRETSSGSIKLLLSSPVKLREIILGKYLALVTLCLAFIAIITLFAITGILTIEHADTGMLMAGIFGLFLLICTYAAIGLFMSCLTNYQIVAAIATLAVFAALRYVGGIGQSMDIVRDITSFLSISGSIQMMIMGLISTKDVAYYLIIIFLFLALSVLYLRNQRELKPWRVKAGRYVLLLVAVFGVGYLTTIPALIGYLDLSAGKQMTISVPAQQVAKKITGKLKITTYVNMLAPNPYNLMPVFRNGDLESQSMYKRFIPGIENEYVYYYHEITDTMMSVTRWNPNFKGIKDIHELGEKVALVSDFDFKNFVGPEEIDKMIDLKPEGYMNIRKLEYNGKSTYLRFFMDEYGQYPQEAEWIAALKRLSVEDPNILFLSGNNETGISDKKDRGYATILSDRSKRKAMVNQGFQVDTINLDSQDLPAKTDILVIADPTVALSDITLGKIKQYIERGGNLLITTNPGRQSVINPVLANLGIQQKPGMLVKPEKDLDQQKIAAVYAPQAKDIDRYVPLFLQAKKNVILDKASALIYDASGPFEIQPLLMSPAGGWNKVVPVNDSMPSLVFDVAQGDERGTFPVAVTLKRKVNGKEQRIIVSGDADYLGNSQFENVEREVKEVRLYSVDILFRWLSIGQFPFDENRPEAKDVDMTVSKEQLSLLTIAFKYILPAILVILGAIILFKRRNN
ncbi:Gldg family protein [Chitinophaga sp. SYP-B3965]|uniref:Gldg family protein n=1 Tax=Chitinophaga sp. SYP-B3965 TaxID=2663120 RepID=UPI001565CDCF|nr:Gldg family protein [Chitinophaga sp. SYP-B3965]